MSEAGENACDGGEKPRWGEWAALYGSSERTLKRWAAHGRDRGDECPLGRPGEMAGWWSRNMTQRIPHKVLMAGGTVPLAPVPVKKPAVAMNAPAPPVAPPADTAREFVGAREDEMGVEATLRRLEDSEVFAHRLYREAIESGDQNKALIAERSFRQLAAEKVKVEEKVREARIKARDLIPREEAEGRIAEVHGELALRFRGLGDRVCRTFGVAVTAETEAKWLDLADEFFGLLREEVLR